MGGMKKQTKKEAERKLPACTGAGSCKREGSCTLWSPFSGWDRKAAWRSQRRARLSVFLRWRSMPPPCAPQPATCIQWRKRGLGPETMEDWPGRGRGLAADVPKGLEGSMAATGTCIWKKPRPPPEAKRPRRQGSLEWRVWKQQPDFRCAQSGCGLRSSLSVQWLCAQRDWARPGSGLLPELRVCIRLHRSGTLTWFRAETLSELHRCENRAWGTARLLVSYPWLMWGWGQCQQHCSWWACATGDRWHHRECTLWAEPVEEHWAPRLPAGAPSSPSGGPISQGAPHHLSAGALSPSGRPIISQQAPHHLPAGAPSSLSRRSVSQRAPRLACFMPQLETYLGPSGPAAKKQTLPPFWL